mmetsp:Transcript_13635/g.27114  ORF Transcript_13635/g.27114 Transcript_13635/m.27114 type:complete len:221 (-) Transcript_13635:8-670(-)
MKQKGLNEKNQSPRAHSFFFVTFIAAAAAFPLRGRRPHSHRHIASSLCLFSCFRQSIIRSIDRTCTAQRYPGEISYGYVHRFHLHTGSLLLPPHICIYIYAYRNYFARFQTDGFASSSSPQTQTNDTPAGQVRRPKTKSDMNEKKDAGWSLLFVDKQSKMNAHSNMQTTNEGTKDRKKTRSLIHSFTKEKEKEKECKDDLLHQKRRGDLSAKTGRYANTA